MFLRLVYITLLGVVVGCSVALLAVLFVDLVIWLNDLLVLSPRARILFAHQEWINAITVLVPALGGVIVGFIVRGLPAKRPYNVPDAIQASQTLDGAMPVKPGILSSIAACISLGSGASVGQYGPLAYMGASVGSWLSRLFASNQYLGTIGIGCGAAAAISTAFNAPIAGLIFAHEVILRHYSLRSFAPITVAATVGYVVANLVFTRPPIFRIEAFTLQNPYEFVGFIGIGIAGAFLAALLIRATLYFSSLNQKIVLPIPVKTGLAGLMVGIIGVQVPEIIGIGKELLRFAIIEGAFSQTELLTIISIKLFLTALCLGFGFAGGIFSPALLIGILFGALVAGSVDSFGLFDRSHIVVYAICGLVALAGPVIGAPLTTILIVFELTRNYDLTTAAMVSVAFANLVSYRIVGRSLFDIQLKNRGFDLSLGRDKVIVEKRKIDEFISHDFLALPTTLTVSAARAKMIEANLSECYVLDENNAYFGKLSIRQTIHEGVDASEPDGYVGAIASQSGLRFHPEHSVWDAMKKLENFVGESIPVIKDQQLLGVVFEATIVSAYLETIDNIRKEENAAG